MSAEIASSETKPEGYESGGAADFILSNSKYHDFFFSVGNPERDKVEEIGVASLYLIANSPVFREMIDQNQQVVANRPPSGDKTEEFVGDSRTHITDVSPATFKLMLRSVYGGKVPKMTSIEAAELALCLDKYKIQHLVRETLIRLNPTSAENVFPAIICVTYATFPDLEAHVSKIIQQETDQVVQHSDFLKLDGNCILFIVKQNTLNISEVELWKHINRWAEHQVEASLATTVRDCLAKILGHVRFLTFTLEEIAEHVLPTNALTPEEFVDLARAVTKRQPLQSSTLCKTEERRNFYNGEDVVAATVDETENKPKPIEFSKSCIFKASDYGDISCDYLYESSCSNLMVKPDESIEIEYFKCKSLNRPSDTCEEYDYSCEITITRTMIGEKNERAQVIELKGKAKYNDFLCLPLKFNSGKPIVLNPGETWTFKLKFDCDHPIYYYEDEDDAWGATYNTHTTLKQENVTFIYGEGFHVVEVAYKKQ